VCAVDPDLVDEAKLLFGPADVETPTVRVALLAHLLDPRHDVAAQ
jgi:hypothetical protein